MRINKENLADYLLDKSYIEPSVLVDGDYSVFQQQSRNIIFQVQTGKGNGLFIKQLMTLDDQNAYLMQKDATVQYYIHKQGTLKSLRPFVPKYHGYDHSCHVMVSENFSGAVNLYEYFLAERRFDADFGREMAEILINLHKPIGEGELEGNKGLKFLTRQAPWILHVADKKTAFTPLAAVSSGVNPVVQGVQADPFLSAELEKLKCQWSRTCLVHGDIKLVNFIITGDKPRLKLVDWEIADIGDPLWDVAGALQTFVSHWVFALDPNSQSYSFFPNFEFFTIEACRPLVQAFWRSYAEAAGWDGAKQKELLNIVMRYCAARMLQTAFETNSHANSITPHGVKLFQLSRNIFTGPDTFAEQLFGDLIHAEA